MVSIGTLSYIPAYKFDLADDEYAHVLSCLSESTLSSVLSCHVKQIVEKAHKNICGHARWTMI